MYSALRNAQTEMNNVLLKFGEDINQSLSLRSGQVPAASEPQTVDQDARNAIDSLNKDLTILIIAHRLTTLCKCDQIIQLSGGKVTRAASYQDIIEQTSKISPN